MVLEKKMVLQPEVFRRQLNFFSLVCLLASLQLWGVLPLVRKFAFASMLWRIVRFISQLLSQISPFFTFALNFKDFG